MIALFIVLSELQLCFDVSGRGSFFHPYLVGDDVGGKPDPLFAADGELSLRLDVSCFCGIAEPLRRNFGILLGAIASEVAKPQLEHGFGIAPARFFS
ncbi:MAG: hypothetical protein SPG07_01090 [Coriobacteriales bacterium]|nr:hypothetical protein [Coriobacteriales bacterium]MDY5661204.1 hypothetical protein [Coriobacteriales bacterium]